MGSTWSGACAFAIQTSITYLSQTGALGKTNKEVAVSEKYNSLVTPAGYAFAIWGVIFSWEGVMVVRQLLKPTVNPSFQLCWISANVFQSLWSFAFAQESMISSSVLLSGIAASLYGCVAHAEDQSFGWVRGPISLHAGWVTVAALLNYNLCLVKFEERMSTQWVAAKLTIAVATVAALGMLWFKKDVMFASSIAWALAAVKDASWPAGIVGAGIAAALASDLSDLVVKK
eukprot:jgi/Bigna1/85136/estExt_fgenesh1_pg.C_20276